MWNDFVANSKNGTFLFHRDFMEYHQNRFIDFSLLLFKGDDLIAIFPANKVEDTVFSHQGLTYGGMILSDAIKFSDVLCVYKELLAFLNDEGLNKTIIKLTPKIYHQKPSDEIEYLLFKTNAILIRRDILSCLKLGNVKLSRDRINGVKRGEKNNLAVKETNGFDEFWNDILIPNLSTKHRTLPVHSLEEITNLKSKFPNNIRQFNVYCGNKIVAGTTIFETKDVAHSQYISGNSDKNTLGSLDYLHNHLIKKVFNKKNYFDFGISNENQGQNINEGLLYWKEGFGARAITQDFYEVKTSNHKKLKDLYV